MLAVALLVSIAGLVLGPALAPLLARAPRGLHILDAVTLALVPGVILTRLLPHLVEDGATGPIAGLLGGYLGFQLLEARVHRGASRLGLTLVLPALAVHALFDGATLGLALGGRAIDAENAAVASAVLLHRIPEGLFVGSIMLATRRAVVWSAVAILAGLTIAGALVGDEVSHALPHELSHVAIAVGLGVMLRMVVDRHGEQPSDARTRLWCGSSFLACVVALVVVPNAHDVLGTATPHELAIREALVPLFLETAPLLVAVLAAAQLGAWLGIAPEGPDDDTWISSSLLCLLLLGPAIAVVRVVASPVARLLLGRLRDPGWWLPRARDLLPAFTVSVAIAAVAEAVVPAQAMQGLPALIAVGLAGACALLLPIGVGAPVIAAVLAHKGAPLSTVLVLILVAAFRPLCGTIRSRVGSAIVVGAIVIVLARWVELSIPELHATGEHAHALHEWLLGGALAGWIALDLARAGPRAWLGPGRKPTSGWLDPSERGD